MGLILCGLLQLHGSRNTRNAVKALFNAFESQSTLAETQKQLGNYRIRELAVGAGALSFLEPHDASALPGLTWEHHVRPLKHLSQRCRRCSVKASAAICQCMNGQAM